VVDSSNGVNQEIRVLGCELFSGMATA